MTLRGMILGCALIAAGSTAFADGTQIVGFRGDGTGRYPDANPPTVWYRHENGESKNILWEVKLPCYTWSTPIIVGDKLITRSEPYDLICMNKKDGKILWIRSHPPFVAVTAAEKAANPAWKEIEPLVAELQKVNDAFVANGWTAELYKKKYDLQHKINDLTAKADKKYELPKDMWNESWCGYTGATPVSDGRFVYINSGSGVAACFDLNGKLRWARFYSHVAGWGEHGDPTTPALIADKLILGSVGLSASTGEEVWHTTLSAVEHGSSYVVVPFKVGKTDYAIIQNQVVRVSDGKNLYKASLFPATTPVVNGTDFYFTCMTWFSRGFHAEPQGDGLKVTELKTVQLPPPADPAKKWEPSVDFYTAGPLYNDGLIYIVGNWGKFSVVDAQKGEIAYWKQLPFDFKNGFGRHTWGCGIGASPAFAGKHVYLIDNAGCTLVIEPGREFKLVSKNNIDYKMPSGWEPGHYEGARHEVTLASPIFEGNRIYIRGEQNLYCIGEK